MCISYRTVTFKQLETLLHIFIMPISSKSYLSLIVKCRFTNTMLKLMPTFPLSVF